MSDFTKEELVRIARRGYEDPLWFLQTFLRDWFPGPMPWVHKGIVAILVRRCGFLAEDPDLPKIIAQFIDRKGRPIFTQDKSGLTMRLTRNTLLMMPRGFSKTTLVNGINLWHLLYQDCRFPVYVSETMTHAETQLRNITSQLTTNALIRTVFGDLKPEQRSGLRWSESQGEVQLSNGAVIMARGRGGQIRGLNVNGRRPDRLLFDDIEDKESVATAEQRQKARVWFFGDAMPALAELDPDSCAVALGTLLHQEALLTVLSSDPDWTTIVFGALDREKRPLWPAMMDEAKIEAKKQSYAVKGLLGVFYLEYFNQVRLDEAAKFQSHMIKVGATPEDQVPLRAIAIDPAISNKPGSSHATIAVVGVSEKQKRIVVLDLWGKPGASPREQIDQYFAMWQRWRPQKAGVESIAFQAALVHLMQEEMFRRKVYFEITPITHSRAKEERVEGILQPRYAAGYVWHQRAFPELETALLDWPNGQMDYPDVVSMAVALLDDYSGFLAEDSSKDEYPPLEDVFDGEWRWA